MSLNLNDVMIYVEGQVEVLKKQGRVFFMQKEQKVRESLSNVFETGIDVLGKGVVMGRKGMETFTAETHRKADKLKKLMKESDAQQESQDEEEVSLSPEESMAAKIEDTPSYQKISKSQAGKMNRRSVARRTAMREKRIRSHSSAARAH